MDTHTDFAAYMTGQRFQTSAEILAKDFPEHAWVIRGWVGQGELVVLAARPKCGKSVLVSQMSLAVATGRPFLDKFETRPGPVLFYDLDDRNQRRVQDRIIDLGADDVPAGNLFYHSDLKPGQEGIETIDQHLTACSTMGHPVKMIVIDCLLAFLGRPDGKDLVRSDRKSIIPLHDLALKHGCGVLLIHHSKKGSKLTEGYASIDSMIGTTGLSSAFDTGIVIENTDKPEHRITFSSRDPLCPDDLILRKDKAGRTGWHVVAGKEPSDKERPVGKVPSAILQILSDGDANLTPKEIVDRAKTEIGVELNPKSVRVYCATRMKDQLQCRDGRYSIIPVKAEVNTFQCSPVAQPVSDGSTDTYGGYIESYTHSDRCSTVAQPQAEGYTATVEHTDVAFDVALNNSSNTNGLPASGYTATPDLGHVPEADFYPDPPAPAAPAEHISEIVTVPLTFYPSNEKPRDRGKAKTQEEPYTTPACYDPNDPLLGFPNKEALLDAIMNCKLAAA